MCHKDISCFRTCSVIFKFCVRVKNMRTYVDSNVKKKNHVLQCMKQVLYVIFVIHVTIRIMYMK